MPGQAGQRPVQRLDPRGVIEPAGHVLGEVRDLPATASRASAARYLRATRRWPRATLVAIPSSQGLSEPPSGAILSRLRQASRNVIAITSSAAGQPEGVVVHRLGARVEYRTERVSIPGPGASPQLRRWIVHIRQLAGPPPGFP